MTAPLRYATVGLLFAAWTLCSPAGVCALGTDVHTATEEHGCCPSPPETAETGIAESDAGRCGIGHLSWSGGEAPSTPRAAARVGDNLPGTAVAMRPAIQPRALVTVAPLVLRI